MLQKKINKNIYYSVFTLEKWEKHVEIRYLMLNDLIVDDLLIYFNKLSKVTGYKAIKVLK
ncbi:hypothetical protein [Crassaminicella profunda]|uniref:hypothetical protein n=1 Tax=Crassaminicella profunda TaxID=1286698 RepID=UPI001CA63496|nr:hypothetical protein [Crassaminicella profunda]QZY55845.1 hypothetical protein K7H06_02170 [Crassaminicella profunda]